MLVAGTFTCVTLGSVTAWTRAFASRYFAMSVGSIGVSLGLAAGALGLVGTLTGGFANDALSRRRPGAGLALLAAVIALSTLLRAASFFMSGYGGFSGRRFRGDAAADVLHRPQLRHGAGRRAAGGSQSCVGRC